MTKAPKISVIIPSNKKEIKTLRAIPKEPVEVIITRAFGLGKSRNEADKRAADGLLIFLDDDIEFTEIFWKKIYSFFLPNFPLVFASYSSRA